MIKTRLRTRASDLRRLYRQTANLLRVVDELAHKETMHRRPSQFYLSELSNMAARLEKVLGAAENAGRLQAEGKFDELTGNE